MGRYRLSKRADADIAGIADYTIRQFGIKQARRYREDWKRYSADSRNIQTAVAAPGTLPLD